MTDILKDRVYLSHILDRVQRIRTYTATGREHFFDSDITQDAVIRNFEVIGEATKQLSTELRLRYPQVPGRTIAGLCAALIHDYINVDTEAVWAIIERDLDSFEVQVQGILSALDSNADRPGGSVQDR